MKKTLLTIAQVAAIAVIMNSCGSNAEEVKKQVDEQNATIQTKVDEKLAGLQTQVDMECTTLIDSTATAMYNDWYATEGKKKGAKPAPKPAPKPKTETKKEETKPDPGKERNGGTGTTEEIQKKRNSDPAATPVENQKKRNN
jgi:hypothetical protein